MVSSQLLVVSFQYLEGSASEAGKGEPWKKARNADNNIDKKQCGWAAGQHGQSSVAEKGNSEAEAGQGAKRKRCQ